jgi:hypothetical protein
MKKRLLALTLALTMAMGMTMTAFAADTTKDISKDTDQTGTANTTEVKYTTESTYTVTIPSDVVVTTAGATAEIKASEVLIASNEKLNVQMVSANYSDDGGFTLQYSTSKITYSILKDNNDVNNKDIVLTVSPNSDTTGKASGSVNLTISTTDNNIQAATMAGEHTDTLTFKVSVDNTESEAE